MKTEIRIKRWIKRILWFLFTTILFGITYPVHVLIYYLADDDRTMKSAVRVAWKSYLWMASSGDNDRRWEEFHQAERRMS